MKALTVRQPWASLIAEGVKTVETRSWSTNYRGPLAIHAGLHKPDVWMGEDGPYGEIFDDASDTCVAQWAQSDRRDYSPASVPPPDERWWLALAPEFSYVGMPLGFVVATCELIDVVSVDKIRWSTALLNQRPYGDFKPGQYAWMLEHIVCEEPVPAKGHQGLWNWEDA